MSLPSPIKMQLQVFECQSPPDAPLSQERCWDHWGDAFWVHTGSQAELCASSLSTHDCYGLKMADNANRMMPTRALVICHYGEALQKRLDRIFDSFWLCLETSPAAAPATTASAAAEAPDQRVIVRTLGDAEGDAHFVLRLRPGPLGACEDNAGRRESGAFILESAECMVRR